MTALTYKNSSVTGLNSQANKINTRNIFDQKKLAQKKEIPFLWSLRFSVGPFMVVVVLSSLTYWIHSIYFFINFSPQNNIGISSYCCLCWNMHRPVSHLMGVQPFPVEVDHQCSKCILQTKFNKKQTTHVEIANTADACKKTHLVAAEALNSQMWGHFWASNWLSVFHLISFDFYDLDLICFKMDTFQRERRRKEREATIAKGSWSA